MEEMFVRIWTQLAERVSGPMTFRLYLQPLMALLFAIRDGVKDAREGRQPFFYSLITDPANRWIRLRQGFNAVSRIFFFAIIMDLIYQLIVIHWFYPGEALIVAFTLAFLPYIIFCGVANRIARSLFRRAGETGRRPGRA
jgi:hypothetical protein